MNFVENIRVINKVAAGNKMKDVEKNSLEKNAFRSQIMNQKGSHENSLMSWRQQCWQISDLDKFLKKNFSHKSWN